MNFKFYKINDKSYIKKIYKEHMKSDFPTDERKPLSVILKGIDNGNYECYGLFDGDTGVNTEAGLNKDMLPWNYELLGYAIFVKYAGNFYLLDYFAVVEKYRNAGFGSVFLSMITEGIKDAECIVCEVEDPDKASDEKSRNIQLRRLDFYLRNGYLKTEITVCLYGVNYRILEAPTGNKHTTEEMRRSYESVYKDMLPSLFFKKYFLLT